jgi:dihydroxyacetone kinase-like protein
MEMQGSSLTLMRLDTELKELLDAPAESPFFLQK